MAVARFTLTADLGDLGLADLADTWSLRNPILTRAFIVTNLPEGEPLVDTSADGAVMIGPLEVDLAAGQTISVELPDTSATVLNWDGVLYRLVVTYPDPLVRSRGTWYSPEFELTENRDIRDVVELDYAPPSAVSEILATMTALVADAAAEADASAASAAAAAVDADRAEAAADAAVDISGIAVDDDIVDVLVRNAGGAGPKTRAALEAGFAKARATKAWHLVDRPAVREHFARKDSVDVNNMITGSGHTLEVTTDGTATMRIVDGKLVPTDVAGTGDPGAVLIVYAQLDEVISSVAAGFEFTDGDTATTGTENIVLGAGRTHFSQGTIQLSMYALGRPGFPGIGWRVFGVPNPITGGEYPTVAEGAWAAGFAFDRTGATTYHAAMHRTGPDQLVLELPDGQLIAIDDVTVDAVTGLSLVRSYFGSHAGWQLRVNAAATDGRGRFTSIATGEAA